MAWWPSLTHSFVQQFPNGWRCKALASRWHLLSWLLRLTLFLWPTPVEARLWKSRVTVIAIINQSLKSFHLSSIWSFHQPQKHLWHYWGAWLPSSFRKCCWCWSLAIKGMVWVGWCCMLSLLLAGTSLIFCIQSQVSFKDKTAYHNVSVSGDIFIQNQLKVLVKVGSVDFQQDVWFWPNMHKELELAYVLSCPKCQCNKSSTSKPIGPLHPLPIPEQCRDSVAIDFIGLLPKDGNFDSIVTFTDCLGSDIQIVPTHFNLTAEKLADLFFNWWYCDNGLPLEIISDCDKLFMSTFWKALHKLTGVKLKMSTAYHLETNGSSEQSNKTIIQSIRFHVKHNQQGWVQALPQICFNIMNTTNKSTGFSPFQLRMGCSPRIIPPLLPNPLKDNKALLARTILEQLAHDVWEAQDNLIKAKISLLQLWKTSRLNCQSSFRFLMGTMSCPCSWCWWDLSPLQRFQVRVCFVFWISSSLW